MVLLIASALSRKGNVHGIVDVRVPTFGTATVMGWIDSADVFQESSASNPAGYVLAVNADGNWQLSSTAFKRADKVLASGNAGGLSNSRHHLRLAFRESKITADLDDKHLADVDNTDHTTGMVAIGSTWTKVAFSMLSVTPAPTPPS